MIEISKVKRIKGRAVEVIVIFDSRIEICFQRINDKVRIVSRTLISGDRLVDKEQLWIPPQWYAQIIKQVMAIFNENR